LPVPAQMQGCSLMPLLRRQATDWQDDVFIQISESQVGRAVRTWRWKYSVVAPGKSGWEDSASDHYVEDFLYDLEADPYELTNLVGLVSHQEVSQVAAGAPAAPYAAGGRARPADRPSASAPQRSAPVSEAEANS